MNPYKTLLTACVLFGALDTQATAPKEANPVKLTAPMVNTTLDPKGVASAPNANKKPLHVNSLAPILKNVMPAVVNIHTQITPPKPFLNGGSFNGAPSDPNQTPPQQIRAFGSGVIFDAKEGYILTNFHVVKDADSISITLNDDRHFPADLVGGDPESDLAVLQIKAKNLTAIQLADSDKLEVGDFVVAIGSPFNLSQTVTSGIVSAMGRSDIGIEGYEDFIQTDAPINPGNSGGALINLKGELVGINTAILSPEGLSIGIGFAIPINMAKNIGEQLIQFGKVRRGLLGVTAQALTPELAEAFGTPNTKGALIDQIAPGSLAEQNGLTPGDVVVSVNNRRVSNASDLRNSVGLIQIGETLSLDIVRDSKPLKISFLMKDPNSIRSEAESIFPQLAGAIFAKSEFQATPQYGVRLADVHTGSPAWEVGLRPQDIIVAANRKPVLNLDDLQSAARLNPDQLLIRVLRDRNAFFTVLKNPE